MLVCVSTVLGNKDTLEGTSTVEDIKLRSWDLLGTRVLGNECRHVVGWVIPRAA